MKRYITQEHIDAYLLRIDYRPRGFSQAVLRAFEIVKVRIEPNHSNVTTELSEPSLKNST